MKHLRDAWIQIDHEALRGNLAHLRAGLQPGVAVCAVVKANAYGHGAVEVAQTLLEAGAEHLAVITLDEATQLRSAGIGAPILLLHEPPRERLDEVLAQDLISCAFTPDTITALEGSAIRARRSARIHLKVDTGLNRLGVPASELEPLLEGPLAKARHLEMQGVFTHLAFADEPTNPVIDRQLERFADALALLDKHGIEPGIRHIANSAATLARPDAHADMVRPGIALYGLAPGVQVPNTAGLRPALSLHARVAQVKRIAPGEGVSYAHRWHADRETTIASIPLGYADGWPRALTNDAQVLIGGVAHRAVGTVCMDSFMVDCGDTPVEVGDPVVLIGSQGAVTLTADTLASRLGTINYEIVARMSPRLPREHRNL